MLGAIVLGIWWLRPQTSREPRPYAALLRRLSVAAAVALAWLTLTLALVGGNPAVHVLRVVAPLAFVLFTIALLMLVPIALRTQALARETALLAGAGTLAASLHLLVAARLVIGPAAAAVIGVTAAVVFYAFVRRAVFAQIEGSGSSASGEQMFESLYRAARDFERDPTQAAAHLKRLLRELFEPLEIAPHAGGAVRARVSPDGSTLVVPLPRLPDLDTGGEVALRLRLARHGSRLFTREDARLAERVMEQLRRAVTFDRAIEQGRTEERMRIAQDLHDDIGARLLTLMYKAHDPEIEEYLRHTLQDLKTLTRGLAASSHPLSDAAAEWKADLTQRLAVTNCEMTWSFSIDRDWILSVTQWSALTRILRELVNNIIAHAQATEVEIVGVCERGRLVLLVSDDGIGRQPASWSHGLGLGGVRKRAKALGGEVSWQERAGRGIRCELRLSLQTGGARTRPRGA
jgi:signal transduction histidine kinase